MKPIAAVLLILALLTMPLLCLGCATYDPLTYKNLDRAREVWRQDADPALPEALRAAREFEFDEALRYENSKK